MRAPTDLPRRRPRPQRGRTGLLLAAGVIFVLLISLRGIAGFYTDFLWFDELGLRRVWRGVLSAKVALAVIFSGIFFVVLWVNLAIADRLAPQFRPMGPEEEIVERYRDLVGRHTLAVRTGAAALFALIVGPGTAGHWNDWILFTNHQSFNIKDPQFHRDIGYFVFQLPFLKFVVDWAFATFVIVLIITAVAHYLNGGIRVQVPAAQRVTPQVKGHLSVLLGILALCKAAGYYFQRFELAYSTRGVVEGAGYTDVHAQLPALKLLLIISIIAFLLFVANIRLRGWVLPVIAVGLWALTSVLAGAAAPAFMQKFRVKPTESVKERPYIQRNIDATRAAMNLKGATTNNFNYDEKLTNADLAKNATTIRNVRLWDPTVVKSTFKELQEIRNFYQFDDVDVDRYRIGDDVTQVILSARGLDTAGIPGGSWENSHLNFTHGYGAVLAPANAVTGNGLPDFLIRDVPPVGEPAIKQPGIYYGTSMGGYAIVKTGRKETDFQRRDGSTQETSYQGEGGVVLSSFVRKAAFALRFGDPNPLISGYVKSSSRVIFVRDIADRARKAAPFLRYDADPYPVVIEGRIKWILDAYTTTSRYPYAQHADTSRLPGTSGLSGGFNYVRNSVKVMVDAYDGTMTFYVIDSKDPIAKAYQKAFPQLFEPGDRISADLRAHLRYPEDLFRVQTNMLGLYHITRASDFYSKADAWEVARDPGSGELGQVDAAPTPVAPGAPAAGAGANAVNITAPGRKMDPYYLLTRLPDAKEDNFLILQPFVPLNKDILSAFVVAKSDPDDYGALEVFQMPRDLSVRGPRQVNAIIQANEDISRLFTLLNARGSGSKVIQGNLLVVPIEKSLLYIRPLYVQSENQPLPEFRKVLVVFGDRAVAADTLHEALVSLFGDAPATREQGGTGGTTTPATPGAPGATPPSGGTTSPDVKALLDQANAAFDAADAALKAGDLAEFQKQVKIAQQLTKQARDQSAAGPAAPASPPPTTTTTAPPTSA